MIGLKGWLSVVGICMLIKCAYSLGGRCSSDSGGDTTYYPVQMDTTDLTPGIRSFKIRIPQGCIASYKAGVILTACDYDVAPIVIMESLESATVIRRGRLNELGVVSGLIYCNSPYQNTGVLGTQNAPELTVEDIPGSRRGLSRPRRHNTLNQARQQNQVIHDSEAQQATDAVRDAVAANQLHANLRQAHSNSRLQSQITSQKAQQVDNSIRNNLKVEARQATLEKASHQASLESRSSPKAKVLLVSDTATANVRLNDLNKARKQARIESERATQVDARQVTDAVREAVADNARLAALEQVRQQSRRNSQRSNVADLRNDAQQASDTRHATLSQTQHRQAIQSRLRRDSQSSDSSQTSAASHDTKTEKSRKVVSDPVSQETLRNQANQDARVAEQTTDAQSKKQRQAVQKRLRRFSNTRDTAETLREALSEAPHDSRQVADVVAASARQASRTLEEAHQATRVLEEARQQNEARHIAAVEDVRQAVATGRDGSDSRVLDLDQVRIQALADAARRTSSDPSHSARIGLYGSDVTTDVRKAADTVRQALDVAEARQIDLREGRTQAKHRSYRSYQTSNTRQGANTVNEALRANAHKSAIEQARLQERYAEAVRQAVDASSPQTALEQINLQDRYGRYYSEKSVDTQKAAEAIRQAVEGGTRHASLQAQTNDRYVKHRSDQRSDTRQSAEAIRQALQANARQEALDQAHRLQDRFGGYQSDQRVNVRQRNEAVRQAMEANRRQAALQTPVQNLYEAPSFDQRSDTLQAVEAVRQAVEANTRQATLNQVESLQDRYGGYQSDQKVNARQADEAIRRAIEANTRQVAMPTQAQDRYEAYSSGQNSDTRQASEAALRGINNHQTALEQGHLRNKFGSNRSDQRIDAQQASEAVRQAALEQVRQQDRYGAYRYGQTNEARQQVSDAVRQALDAAARFQSRFNLGRSGQINQEKGARQVIEAVRDATETNERGNAPE